DIRAAQHAIATESHHLRHAGIGMPGIDADADRLSNGVRLAAPEPWRLRNGRITPAALPLQAMTDRAVVTEQRAARLADHLHQRGIGLDCGVIASTKLLRPDSAALCCRLHA